MKVVKIFVSLIVVLLLLLAIGLYFLLANLGGIVKDVVETQGPEVTGTTVKLDGVGVALLDGAVEIKGLVIGNPKGFKTDHLFKIDALRLSIDPMSVTTGVIVLNDITIDGVGIIAEQKGLDTNLQALLRNVQKNVPASGSSSAPKDAEHGTAGAEPRFYLDNLLFANNSMTLATESYGSYELEIPTLERKKIGSPATGLTAPELGKAILEPMLKAAEKAAKERLKKLAKSEVEDELKAKLEQQLDAGDKETVDKIKGFLGR